jgi:predicted RNA-binding Zn-ribbon protein involved in translation (DUF1610 family)
MTARDRFTHDLTCPQCGKAGVAEVSQADGWSFMRDDNTTVDEMPEGFQDIRQQGDKRPIYECIDCGLVVKS